MENGTSGHSIFDLLHVKLVFLVGNDTVTRDLLHDTCAATAVLC